MIQNIRIWDLRNPEYAQFIQDVLQITEKYDPAKMNVSEYFNVLKELFADVETLYKIPAGSAISKELKQLDKLRDDALTGINLLIRGNSYSEEEVIARHAETLLNHLAGFGSHIQLMNYQSETAALRNIINDWDNIPELTAAIAALNLGAWKTALENANNIFSQRYLDRAEKYGQLSSERMVDIRNKANAAYFELRNELNAHWRISKGAEPYNSVVNFINGLIDGYNDSLSKRSGTTDEVTATETNDASEVK